MDTNSNNEMVETVRTPIGVAEINRAEEIRRDYQNSKQHFDHHIVQDEEWWKLRHWDVLNAEDGKEASPDKIDPKSAWLFSQVMSKHADFIDAAPTFAVLPREEGDKETAELLSQVLPVIFQQNNIEKTYDRCCLAKVKHGTAIYGVFWNGEQYNGLGDVEVREVDALNLVWEPGIEDIQDSANVFFQQLVSKEAAKEMYPILLEKESMLSIPDNTMDYSSPDYISNADKVRIVEWYYKKDGLLHLCKYCCGIVIDSTENQPDKYPNGLYRHGEYPFHIDVMYPLKNTCGGFGIIDIEKSAQEYIDRLSKSVINNAEGVAKPKTYINESAGVNIDDISDPDKDIIRFAGDLDDRNFRTVQGTPLSSFYLDIINAKIAEMHETSGNHDVSNGNIPAGVTAASAIAALQEQAGKTSRSVIKGTYRVFAGITKMVIELIREFYTQPRIFRITGAFGKMEFVSLSSENMAGREVSVGEDSVFIDPLFDVEVYAQKASPYSSMAHNELALQLYNAGFFAPERADAAIMALKMMDFKDKDKLIDAISRNGTMHQLLVSLTERLNKAEEIIKRLVGATTEHISPERPMPAVEDAEMPEQNNEGVVDKESSITAKARKESAETVIPR